MQQSKGYYRGGQNGTADFIRKEYDNAKGDSKIPARDDVGVVPYYAVTLKTLYSVLRRGASGMPRATAWHKILDVTR